jgi:hypothetical protein
MTAGGSELDVEIDQRVIEIQWARKVNRPGTSWHTIRRFHSFRVKTAWGYTYSAIRAVTTCTAGEFELVDLTIVLAPQPLDDGSPICKQCARLLEGRLRRIARQTAKQSNAD